MQSSGAQGADAALEVPRTSQQKDDVVTGNEDEQYADAAAEPDDMEPEDIPPLNRKPTEYFDAPSEEEDMRPQLDSFKRISAQSFTTASSHPADAHQEHAEASSSKVPTQGDQGINKVDGLRSASTAAESSNGGPSEPFVDAPSVDAVSTTSLLQRTDVTKDRPAVVPESKSKSMLARVKRRSKNASGDSTDLNATRTRSRLSNLVKFDIPEDSKRAELHLRAKSAQMTIRHASTKLRRQKLKDGLIVKMERMLVRVDKAGMQVPEDFDENADQKVDSRVKDKWREYMVVCRQSISDEADFVLQLYKTRVCGQVGI